MSVFTNEDTVRECIHSFSLLASLSSSLLSSPLRLTRSLPGVPVLVFSWLLHCDVAVWSVASVRGQSLRQMQAAPEQAQALSVNLLLPALTQVVAVAAAAAAAAGAVFTLATEEELFLPRPVPFFSFIIDSQWPASHQFSWQVNNFHLSLFLSHHSSVKLLFKQIKINLLVKLSQLHFSTLWISSESQSTFL